MKTRQITTTERDEYGVLVSTSVADVGERLDDLLVACRATAYRHARKFAEMQNPNITGCACGICTTLAKLENEIAR